VIATERGSTARNAASARPSVISVYLILVVYLNVTLMFVSHLRFVKLRCTIGATN